MTKVVNLSGVREAVESAQIQSPAPPLKALGAQPSHLGELPGSFSGGVGGGGRIQETNRKLAFFALTDLGNAARFVARYGDDFKYCPEWGWLAWDGSRWNRDQAEGLVAKAVHETVRAIKEEAAHIKGSDDDFITDAAKGKYYSDQVSGWAKASQSNNHITCIARLAAPYLETATRAFDADPYKINVANGTLHVARRESEDFVKFCPHDRGDLITKLSPVVYDPNASCPVYDDFLAYVQPDVKVRVFLQCWGGLSLIGDATEQKLAFFYGKGKNGKSTLVDAWAHVAGDYAETVPIETFLDQGRTRRGGDATPDLAILPGVRFLRTSEPEKGAKLAEALIKLATGGEAMKARHLNKDFFTFMPQFKLTISGNYRPQIDGTDDGIWRRVMLIPWTVRVSDERRDAGLGKKLVAEASGILNWMLDGLRVWMERGLVEPEVVIQATDEYRNDSDPLGRFLTACVVADSGQRVQSSVMHEVFAAWCKVNDAREWTATGFGKAMRERGFRSKHSSVIWWLDVRLTKTVYDFVDHHGHPLPGAGAYADD
jgi:putative DNA primase/helicase